MKDKIVYLIVNDDFITLSINEHCYEVQFDDNKFNDKVFIYDNLQDEYIEVIDVKEKEKVSSIAIKKYNES